MFTPFFHALPIRRKLTLMILIITGTALLLFSLLSAFNQIRLLRRSMLDNLNIMAQSIADLSAATLSFKSVSAAAQILNALKADPDIEFAVIYGEDKVAFANYLNPQYAETALLPASLPEAGHTFIFQDRRLKMQLFYPIVLDGLTIGRLYILANTNKMVEQLGDSAILLVVSFMAVLAVTLLVSASIQDSMTKPVFSLARTARKISEEGDYSIRVKRKYTDEIGNLIDDFNTMLEAIEIRDAELNEHRNNLEILVRERTEELRMKRDEALAAAKAKSEFLANMSHEIRTPMNGVIGVLSLLRDAPLTEEYRRLLDSASRSADSLLLIINDILDFSKIDAGKIDLESIVFDLREIMEETSELFIDTVNLKNLDMVCFVPLEIHCRIKGDPTRLRQILTNLVSNAVKFTEKGEVVLQVELVEKEGNRQSLRFSVEDTGIGISAKVIQSLFEKFTQADGSTTRKYGGTGLGLSVCKQLVEMQGGEIGVNSVEGQGSHFWFVLPFEVVPEPSLVIPCQKIENKRFLVVDDNATNRMIIEHYLGACPVQVSSCGSAGEALALLASMDQQGLSVDTVLLDYHMPGTDGLQLARRIKEIYQEQAPEMIMLSSGRLAREDALAAGIRSVIYKPVRQLQLYDTLISLVPDRNHTLKKAEDAQKKDIRLQGRVLLVDDEPINQKVAEAILQKFGLVTEVAGNGWEAVQMVEAGDYSLVLMDIQMPEMSGFEATEIIRKREQQGDRKRVAIIAMTANAMEATRQRCLAIGMDDFITKPIKPDVLAERLFPWLGVPLRDEAAADGGDAVTAEGKVWGQQHWDRAMALEFVGGDTELLRQLIELFLQRNAELLGRVGGAVTARDGAALREAAHAYKGALNHFAASTAREIAFALENAGRGGELDNIEELWGRLQAESARLQAELQQAYDGQKP